MICVSIGRSRHKHMLAEHAHLVEQGAEMVELRLDYISSRVNIHRLLKDRPCPTVITVRRDGGIDINLDPVAGPEVEARLRALYAMRGDRVVFVRAVEELEFATVAQVIDKARGVGLTQIALMSSDEQ